MSITTKDYNCLQSILESVAKIENYIKSFKTADELYQENKSFDAVLMNFIVIGEMAEKLSEDFKQNSSHIDWINIKGFRNLIAHNYFGIDAEEFWEIIHSDISNLKIELEKIV
jgi:uncharacterized protein with HEPN domain